MHLPLEPYQDSVSVSTPKKLRRLYTLQAQVLQQVIGQHKIGCCNRGFAGNSWWSLCNQPRENNLVKFFNFKTAPGILFLEELL